MHSNVVFPTKGKTMSTIFFNTMHPLTFMLLKFLFIFFTHLKLELLAQIPALHDEKYVFLWKICYMDFSGISFWSETFLEQIIYGSGSI